MRADNDPKKDILCKEMASQFHRTTAQLLFLCLRACPDIQTAVSFFTTRARNPDMDDWKKLRHCMRYFKSTMHMKRHLSADNLTNLMWWVDGSYWVHWISKGHTGSMMSMGKGQGRNSERVKKAQAQRLKFNGVRVSKYCGCSRCDDMVQVFHGSTRPYDWW